MLMFRFSTPPQHASARQGLDMLLMAVSLEQQCVAIYSDAAIAQLITPVSDPDGLRKLPMLSDIFDFESFYVEAESFAQTEYSASDFRVPVKLVSKTELIELQQQAKHIIKF